MDSHSARGAAPAHHPRFVTGSIMRHVLVMALAGALGLVAVFSVDLLNLFYLARLGRQAVLAAVGFAGVVGFVQISIGIGLAIGIGAVVSAAIGARRVEDARRIATNSLVAAAVLNVALAIVTVILANPLLAMLGAAGEARGLARLFLIIAAPSLPFLGTGMCGTALLRSVGDARRSMNVTLLAAVAASCFDPLLIFGLHLGIAGAALSTLLSRMMLGGLAVYYLARHHRLLVRPCPRRMVDDLRQVGRIAGPATLTNLATPVGSGIVTHAMASFGPAAVAGQAVIDRLTPLAFGIVYALSGAVGPIMAQNLGAGRTDRVKETLRNSLIVVLAVVLGAWALLAAAQTPIVQVFASQGQSAVLIRLFCNLLAGAFLFNGALFVANAAFNNLGHPFFSTGFNWGRVLLGTLPLVMLARHHGAGWVLGAQAGAGVVFGSAAVITAFRVTARLPAAAIPAAPPIIPGNGLSGVAMAEDAA